MKLKGALCLLGRRLELLWISNQGRGSRRGDVCADARTEEGTASQAYARTHPCVNPCATHLSSCEAPLSWVASRGRKPSLLAVTRPSSQRRCLRRTSWAVSGPEVPRHTAPWAQVERVRTGALASFRTLTRMAGPAPVFLPPALLGRTFGLLCKPSPLPS